MSAHCIMGVDPGLKGAVAFYFPTHPELVSVIDMPVADNEIDSAQLADRIRQMNPDVAIIEHVWSQPGNGTSQAFRFGENCGQVKGVIGALQIPSHRVTPNKWKKHFRLSSDKEEARALAIRLWPSSEHFRRRRDEGRAEAALIARYFAETNDPCKRWALPISDDENEAT